MDILEYVLCKTNKQMEYTKDGNIKNIVATH